jgi:hypothetical protein
MHLPFVGQARVAAAPDGTANVPRNAKSGEPEGSPDLARAAYPPSAENVKRAAPEKCAKSDNSISVVSAR